MLYAAQVSSYLMWTIADNLSSTSEARHFFDIEQEFIPQVWKMLLFCRIIKIFTNLYEM